MSIDFTSGVCNSEYYVSRMKNARKKHGKPIREDPWFLQDNASIHTSLHSADQILRSGFRLLDHPLYSPDLATSDFHTFLHLK